MSGHDSGDEALRLFGVLALLFMAMAWWRRRRPEGSFHWRPSPQAKPERAPRGQALLAAAGLAVLPLAMYLEPQAFWDTATLGHGVPGGLALTDAFLDSWQRTATIGWLLAYIAVWLAVAVQGGWRRWTRHAGIFTGIGLGLMLAAHAAPMTTLEARVPFAIFAAPGVDAVAVPWFGLAGAMVLLGALYELYVEWTRVEPAPAAAGGAIARA